MKEILLSAMHPVWVSAGVLQEFEIENLLNKGIDVSVLNYAVDTENRKDVECAISTIKEHHFGENIWVQIENKN
ncbi:hypothetical protein IMCC1989_1958 [gamma proteobacterium IMCC1989]|nr:hypothetical protein IMCC1989_1958 [gamma proteobacterium IMCC1989]